MVLKNRSKITCVVVCSLILILCSCGNSSSHIKENVPNSEEFNSILIQNLQDYFKKRSGKENIKVEYELLRKAPTQSGTAYPKYYMWVTIKDENAKLEDGAVRVAAIDKNKFEITDYLTQTEIKRNPEVINNIFPKEVCVKIKEKIK